MGYSEGMKIYEMPQLDSLNDAQLWEVAVPIGTTQPKSVRKR